MIQIIFTRLLMRFLFRRADLGKEEIQAMSLDLETLDRARVQFQIRRC